MPLATAALLFVHASHHYDASDMSRTVIFRDYGLEMLRAIPDKPRVLLLTLGDEVLNAARFVHRQLGVRPLHASAHHGALASPPRCSTRRATCTGSSACGPS